MVIGAGAGMGVDCGLPDFRGSQRPWKAYPPYAKLGLGFLDLADPRWFRDDPALACGFYGHRLNLYHETVPLPGFDLLRDWAGRMPGGVFVYTSNVDGQFQEAGFDPGLLFNHVLSAEHLAAAVVQEAGKICDRIFTPVLTPCLFLAQVLSDDHSCRAAVARLLAWRTAQGLPPCSADTGGYCKARQRLPESVLPRLARDTAGGLQQVAPEPWRFHGRAVTLVDGSTVSMADAAENLAEYPQHGNQGPGCGFPIARIVVLIALATGAVLDAAVGPRNGWSYGLEEEVLAEGRVNASDSAALAAATEILLEKRLSSISSATPQFALALRGTTSPT